MVEWTSKIPQGGKMNYSSLEHNDIAQLFTLMQKYKNSIGESPLEDNQFAKLKSAIAEKRIEFFVAKENENLCAMCSIVTVFSTFTCGSLGVFEDFYIAEDYRGKGVARGLTQHVFNEMKTRGVAAIWVGCADMDIDMYTSLGFDIKLGNLLTWSAQ